MEPTHEKCLSGSAKDTDVLLTWISVFSALWKTFSKKLDLSHDERGVFLALGS